MNVTYTTELADAYTFLTELEAAKHSAYLDTATPQQITIGVGSNIQDAGNAGARVLAIAAVVPESLSDSFTKLDSNGNTVIDQVARTEYAQYRDALDGIIRSGDLTRLNNFVHLNGLTAGEQTQYANLLNYQNLLPTSFTIPNTDAGNTDIRGIYDETVSIYTQKVVRFLEPITSSSALTLNSNEKIALLSLAFNEKSSNPLLLPGGDLFQAIKSGDRVAAWYEIAFRSNAPIEDENKVSTGRRSLGIENRRIKEATKFSLYEPQNASTPADELLAEAKTIYRFLTLKRDDMDAYFQSMSHIDSSGQPKVDGELTPTEIDALLWNPIQTQLDNARKAIVDDLNVKDPNLNLDAAAYLSTDVYLDPGRDSTTGTVDPDHFNLNMTGSDRNDLILGEGGIDFLNGGLGNDALFGGDGFDRLDGGEGNDTLVGGTGNDTIDGGIGSDTYIYNNGDGADVITDAQGLNHIRANGSNLGGLFDGNALYSLESGNVMRWEINGGEHVYEYDATLQTVKISGSALGGANDSITIENVADLADLKSRFAIDLQTPVEAVVTTDNSNPLTSSGNTVTDLTAAIGEQGSGRIGVGLNQPLHAGDKIIIKATSNFDLNLLKLIDGANIIDFTNGEVTLDAQEGQSFLSLGFIQQGELTQDANVVFTASIERTLPDGTTEVVDASNSFNLNITDSVPATDPAQAQTTKDILGDPLIHSATIAPGGQGPDWKVVNAYNHVYVDDGNGNQQLVSYDVDYFLVDADGHPTEGLQQVRDDRLNDSTGNDHIMSGAGNDVIG
ncbi:calcium-binding protein, partial [Pseudomonadota bacterium]